MTRFGQRQLDEIAQQALDGVLSAAGFVFLRGVYFREIDSGIRHVIILDYAPKKRTLFVIVGINSRFIAGESPPDEAGVYVSKYLGPGGLATNPVGYPAFDPGSATESLERLRAATEQVALPWFATFERPSDLANALPEQDDLFKGKLFLAGGDHPQARVWLERYLARLRKMPDDAEVRTAIRDTEGLLASCN
jgi:hypothetical protein